MSGRRVRNALLLAIVAGIGYWIYTYRPTVAGIVDTITSPLFGSRAAVSSSEHNRVRDEASTVVAEQTDPTKVTSLRPGMTRDEIRELLGKPDAIDKVYKDGVEEVRWTYRESRRVILFRDNRVVSISVL
jgi:hypothetical protein